MGLAASLATCDSSAALLHVLSTTQAGGFLLCHLEHALHQPLCCGPLHSAEATLHVSSRPWYMCEWVRILCVCILCGFVCVCVRVYSTYEFMFLITLIHIHTHTHPLRTPDMRMPVATTGCQPSFWPSPSWTSFR